MEYRLFYQNADGQVIATKEKMNPIKQDVKKGLYDTQFFAFCSHVIITHPCIYNFLKVTSDMLLTSTHKRVIHETTDVSHKHGKAQNILMPTPKKVVITIQSMFVKLVPEYQPVVKSFKELIHIICSADNEVVLSEHIII